MGDYPDSGSLFANKAKKHERAPDYDGKIEIGPDTLRYLVQQSKGNRETTLKIAGWKKQSKAGATFLSLKLSVPKEMEERPAPRRGWMDDDIPF